MSGHIDPIDGKHVKKILYKAYKCGKIVKRTYSLNTDASGEVVRTVAGVIHDDILWFKAAEIDADHIDVYVNNEFYKTYPMKKRK